MNKVYDRLLTHAIENEDIVFLKTQRIPLMKWQDLLINTIIPENVMKKFEYEVCIIFDGYKIPSLNGDLDTWDTNYKQYRELFKSFSVIRIGP